MLKGEENFKEGEFKKEAAAEPEKNRGRLIDPCREPIHNSGRVPYFVRNLGSLAVSFAGEKK